MEVSRSRQSRGQVPENASGLPNGFQYSGLLRPGTTSASTPYAVSHGVAPSATFAAISKYVMPAIGNCIGTLGVVGKDPPPNCCCLVNAFIHWPIVPGAKTRPSGRF